MKKRMSVFLNFISYNLLFFALYLNFIHKDAVPAPVKPQQLHSSIEAAFSEKAHASVIGGKPTTQLTNNKAITQ